MPQTSRWTVPVPPLSLPTFLLGPASSPLQNLPSTLAYADASNPSLSLTWQTLRLYSQRLAAGLLAAGLQPQDRVLIFAPNNVMYPVVWMGVLMAGGIYSSANARFVPRELAYQWEITRAKFLLVSRENVSTAVEAAKLCQMGKERMFVFDESVLLAEKHLERPEAGVLHWSRLFASEDEGRNFSWEEFTPEMSRERTAALLFSSGTTGLPKGVELTHYNLIANVVQTNLVMSLDPSLSTVSHSSRASRWLCCLPLYHGLGLCYFFTIAVHRRVPTYIMPQFDATQMLQHIQDFAITELHLVPPIVVGMAKNEDIKRGKFDLSSVAKTFSCAAPLGVEATLQYERLWPKGAMNVKQGLAMTESGCNTLGWDPTLTAPPGSVGEPMPNCEIMLVDDAEKEVPRGQRGEIWVRAPNVMKGYWDNAKATAAALAGDGWLKTGDVGVQDEQGWYYIVDRKKEFIKVKAVQVAPAELEALLLDHPGIADAAVIGVKRGDAEFPRAYVVRTPGAQVSAAEIMQYMDGRVSTIKRLTGGVIFTDSIPRAPSGKILRRILRESDSQAARAKL